MTREEWDVLAELDRISDEIYNGSEALAESIDRVRSCLSDRKGWPEYPEGADSSRENDITGVIEYFDTHEKFVGAIQVVDGKPSGAEASTDEIKTIDEVIKTLALLQGRLEAVRADFEIGRLPAEMPSIPAA